jgi:hypothetical protein
MLLSNIGSIDVADQVVQSQLARGVEEEPSATLLLAA